MIENIEVGQSYTATVTVTDKDTALAYGSGGLEVFATPAMISLMESAAYNLLKDAPCNVESVGIEINVAHTRACLVGTEVTAEAKVVAVEGKRVSFTISASDKNGSIGNATHIRYIIEPEKFMQRVAQ